MCVFFNDTATTEIYTYGHTLSLHDALPIFDHEIGERVLAVLAHATEVEPSVLRRDAARAAHELTGGTLGLNACHGCASRNAEPISRSEEHTSELQSLMRISYAVFCLKKKNTQQNPQSEHMTHNE